MKAIFHRKLELNYGTYPNETATQLFSDETLTKNSPWSPYYYLREEPWAIPLMVTCFVNITVIIVFEVFVVFKAFQGAPSRRHFFLGQCLLFGLVLMSLSGFSFALQPTRFSCASSRALIGISPAIVFGTLLVKCVFLISLHTGVYLPAYYQGILLFFIVLVQGAITIQWMATQPATTREATAHEISSSCESTYKNFVLSLLYVMVLVLMVAVFSLKCRRVRENYRESSYIGFSLCIIIPMWFVWVMTGFALSPRIQPACLGFGSVITAIIIFLVMFIPKSRQMVAVGQDGFFTNDKNSSISSDSDEKYSPSFLMFQPIRSSKQLILGSGKNDSSIFKPDLSVSGSNQVDGNENALYSTIETQNKSRMTPDQNFYLFRSHSNLEMMY